MNGIRLFIVFVVASFTGGLWEIMQGYWPRYDCVFYPLCFVLTLGNEMCSRIPFLCLYGFCAVLVMWMTEYLGKRGIISVLLISFTISFLECTNGWIAHFLIDQSHLWNYPDAFIPFCDRKASVVSGVFWALPVAIYQWKVSPSVLH